VYSLSTGQRTWLASNAEQDLKSRERPTVVTKARGIDDCQADPDAVLLELDIDGLDLDSLLDVGAFGDIGDLVGEDLTLAEGVYECGATGSRGTCGPQCSAEGHTRWKPAATHRRP
jgi:hypothetical protein